MKPGFYDTPETKWLTVQEILARGLDQRVSYAVLTAPLHFQPPTGPLITVPVAYITDFASVPRIFWSIFPPYDPYYGAPAIVHDYGYSTKGDFGLGLKLTRADVDRMFLMAMILQDTERWRRNILYAGVRLGGASTWNKERPSRVIAMNAHN
jgi:hypothetical protein